MLFLFELIEMDFIKSTFAFLMDKLYGCSKSVQHILFREAKPKT